MLEDLKTFYARFFTKGDMKEAVQSLNQFNNEIRRKDAISIAFWSGGTSVWLIVGAFLISIKSSDTNEDHNKLISSINILRLTFVLIYILFCTAIAIKVFLFYGVNYLYIFELDPNYKMTAD